MRIWLTVGFATMYVPVWAAMPAAEQNALVKQYCAVCHTDAAMNGGLSLQHYDAAKRDPTLAAMILSKLNAGAIAEKNRCVSALHGRAVAHQFFASILYSTGALRSTDAVIVRPV